MASIKTWIKAARLRTLPLSLSGIIVGSFIAYHDGIFQLNVLLLALLTTLGFQVLSNFANDLGDAQKGADNEGRIGPERAIQSGEVSISEMKIAVYVLSVASFVFAALLIGVSAQGKDASFWYFYLFLALACIAAAIAYTVGKKAYGYHGLGDVFVFIFFGVVSVVGVYHLYPSSFSITSFEWKLLLPATTIGALSMAVLNLNNMRDRQNDVLVGKNTLAVKLGKEKAKQYHAILIVVAILSMFIYVINFQSSWYFLLLIVPSFILIKHLVAVFKTSEEKGFDPFLKTVSLTTFLISILFVISTILNHVSF